MNRDGSDARQLTFGVSATSPSVRPDSRWVVYDASNVATARLFKVSIDGVTPQELTTATSHFPVVSPDGRSIAFLYYAGGTAPTTLSIVGIERGHASHEFPCAGRKVPVGARRPRAHLRRQAASTCELRATAA
jgi:Tol biopolymer transport system component